MNYKYPLNIANSKLIFILNSFSKSEMKEFRKFLSSPVYTSGRNYMPLLNSLLKKRIVKNPGRFNVSEDKSIQTYRNRSSELFKLAEEYLIFKSLKKSKIEKNRILLQSYLDCNLSKYFEGRYKKVKKIMENLPDDELKFQSISSIEQMNLRYIMQNEEFRNVYEPYHDYTTTSVCISLLNLFDFGIEYIQQEMANKTHEFNVVRHLIKETNFNEIIFSFQKSENQLHKLVVIQYYFYKAFESPDKEKNYFTAKKMFDGLADELSRDFLIRQYKHMTNYCIMRRNVGERKFELELFKLYNERLRFEIYNDEKKVFPVSTFRNYVLLGLMLKKYRWTETFIKKYSSELPEESRDDEVRISYSRLFFNSKEYKRSLENLKNIKGHNYLYYCDSSILKLCCYYEIEKYEDAFFEIDKLRHYLRNHREIQKIHKEYFSNFLKFYQALLKSVTDPGRKKEFLLKQLKEVNFVSKRIWLEEKIKEVGYQI